MERVYTMQNIVNDIKNRTFRRVYLLYGEEAYLKRNYRNRLKQAIAEDDSMNYHYFEGKGIDTRAVIDMAETLPFFADFRLLVLENTGFFKAGNEDMAEYLKHIPESTIFIFNETEVDKRSRIFKAVKEAGYACEMVQQTESKLVPWVLNILKKENKKITNQGMQLLFSRTGNDMENISKEVEKLICYTLGREEILPEDIEAVCSVQTTGKIFDMLTAVSEKKQKKALELYYDLLTLKEPPMRILFLMSRQFNLFMQVKQLTAQGCDNALIAKKTGLQSFLVGKYAAQARHFSQEFLRNALTECLESEELVKTGRLEDRLCVELLIVKYSAA